MSFSSEKNQLSRRHAPIGVHGLRDEDEDSIDIHDKTRPLRKIIIRLKKLGATAPENPPKIDTQPDDGGPKIAQCPRYGVLDPAGSDVGIPKAASNGGGGRKGLGATGVLGLKVGRGKDGGDVVAGASSRPRDGEKRGRREKEVRGAMVRIDDIGDDVDGDGGRGQEKRRGEKGRPRKIGGKNEVGVSVGDGAEKTGHVHSTYGEKSGHGLLYTRAGGTRLELLRLIARAGKIGSTQDSRSDPHFDPPDGFCHAALRVVPFSKGKKVQPAKHTALKLKLTPFCLRASRDPFLASQSLQ